MSMKAVLIAEDNAINRELVAAIISVTYPDVTVLEAEDGETAVAIYCEHRPQMVLMDLHMPKMDGVTSALSIRRAETEFNIDSATQAHVPIFALTADTSQDEEVRCHNAGMDGVLIKPVTPAVLRNLLDQYL